jgi:hypothetical protein
MKKTLLSISVILGLGAASVAQTYTPAAGTPLADGEVGTAYSQTINAAIPATANITGQQILDILPAAVAGIAGAAITPGTSYPITVTSTVLTVDGLPGGLSDDCNGCSVTAGSNQDIVISGSPTAAGSSVVNITSSTAGETTIQGFTIPFGGQFDTGIPLVPPVDIPMLPGVLDASGYTLEVTDPNSIAESNEVFSLGLYPNPTEGISTLDVNSTVAGTATVEVYSITGSLVQTSVKPIRVGANRLSLDFTSVPAGIYLVKADINGHQALVRTQKK